MNNRMFLLTSFLLSIISLSKGLASGGAREQFDLVIPTRGKVKIPMPPSLKREREGEVFGNERADKKRKLNDIDLSEELFMNSLEEKKGNERRDICDQAMNQSDSSERVKLRAEFELHEFYRRKQRGYGDAKKFYQKLIHTLPQEDLLREKALKSLEYINRKLNKLKPWSFDRLK